MNGNINNLGGFRVAELVFVDDILRWDVVAGKVNLSASIAYALPASVNGIQLSATGKSDKNGLLYTIKGIIKLKNRYLSADTIYQLKTIQSRGCVVTAMDNNGDRWVYGSPDYPLFGSLEQIVGSKPGDLHRWQLTLQSTSLTPELALL